MLPNDAAKLLDVPIDATPEVLERRFLELRAKLEDKIAKAPTPGLKAKYRESLNEITTAFETLTLAADSSALPVLQKQGAASQEPGAVRPEATSTRQPAPVESASSRSVPKKKTGSKEFAIVAMVAVVLLAAGGWFVMKTRVKNAEKARLAAEQKAEAERQAAADRAEQARLERLAVEVRSRLAELNVTHDSLSRLEANAERELNELRSQERDAQREAKGNLTPALRLLSAQTRALDRFVSWMRTTLPSHPAKIARAKTEELLQGRATEAAAAQLALYASALTELLQTVEAERASTDLMGRLHIGTNLAGTTWRLIDVFGGEVSGEAPADLAQVPSGKAKVTFSRPPWPDITKEIDIARRQENRIEVEFLPAEVSIATKPADATISLLNFPTPPGRDWKLEPGIYTVVAEHPNHAPEIVTIRATSASKTTQEIELKQDYATSALRLAKALLPLVTSDDEYIASASEIARLLQESGDSSGALEVLDWVSSRNITALHSDQAPIHLAKLVVTAALLGNREKIDELAGKTDALVDAKKINVGDEFTRGYLFHGPAAAFYLLGDRTKAQSYLRGFLDQGTSFSKEKFFWGNISVELRQLDRFDKARECFENARAASLRSNYPDPMEDRAMELTAHEAATARDPVGFERSVREFLRIRLAKAGRRIDYSEVYSFAAKVAKTGFDEGRMILRKIEQELIRDKMLEDPSQNTGWVRFFRQFTHPDVIRTERENILRTQKDLFAEAWKRPNRTAAVSNLLKLHDQIRRFYPQLPADFLPAPASLTKSLDENTERATKVNFSVEIMGAVNRPGSVGFVIGEVPTVAAAIERAGGFSSVGDPRSVRLYRVERAAGPDKGQYIENVIDSPAFPVQLLREGDRIFVRERTL